MKAAYVEALGGADTIRYGDLPDPALGPGAVLVRVEAVAVNRVDTYVRSGGWRTPVTFPLVVGRDLVGTVAAVGPGVDDIEPDARVWTSSAGYDGRPGATAELVAVQRDRLYPMPDGADPVGFVAAIHPATTAHGVLRRARPVEGETVVVVGANGAVGLCLVQAAAELGSSVVAVVRNRRAAHRLGELGAARVVVSEAASAPAAAAEGTAGIDVLVDATGLVDLGAAVGSLDRRGRLVLIAGRGEAQLDVWPFYTRELQISGFIMSGMTVAELRTAADWIIGRHAVRPVTVSVGGVARFADAARAHARLEAGELPRLSDGTVGRLVLTP